MFDTVYASRFIRPVESGKTKPNLIECEKADGSMVEVIVKCSSMTIQGTRDLAVEAICGMLASDLGLPVPDFFAVDISEDFRTLITDRQVKHAFDTADSIAFGSKALPQGFTLWGKEQPVPDSLCEVAAEIFTFDAIVVNGDRRPENANCLYSGSEVAIIDHELCFGVELLWVEPWLPGGFNSRSDPTQHIFAKPRLTRCPDSLARFEKAWEIIDAARIDEYLQSLPPTWHLAQPEADRIKNLLLDAKQNIHLVVEQSLGVLR